MAYHAKPDLDFEGLLGDLYPEFSKLVAECEAARKRTLQRQARGLRMGFMHSAIEVYTHRTDMVWC